MTESWQVPDESREVWSALGRVAPAGLSEDAAERIGRTLAAAATHGSATTEAGAPGRGLLAASIAVALAVGGVGGYGIAAVVGQETVPAGREYLLLVHETPETRGMVAEGGADVVVEEYARWARSLASEGRLVSAEKLTDEPGWVGRNAAASSSISGFFLIRADSRAEALRIARESPHAAHGGVVEVREVER